jgi:hypothetical protein
MRRAARASVIAVVVMFVVGMGLAKPEPVLADPGMPTGTRMYAEMVRVGVDHDIAEAAGYDVRIDGNGVEYAVPKGSPPGLDNTVPGPCGTSWVDWDQIDSNRHSAYIFTGFTILQGWPAAVSVPTWQTTVIDNYGVSTREHGPILDVIAPTHAWAGKYLKFTAGGPTGASVEVTLGTAILANGTVCVSLHPWDYADL